AEEEVSGVSTADCALDLHGGDAAAVYTSEHGGIWAYSFDGASSSPTFTGAELTSAYAPLDIDGPADFASATLVVADATTDGVVLLDAAGVEITTLAERDVP